jgi:hypothetical protein
LAQELLQQVEQDATAAGIDEEEIQKKKAASERMALENQRREEEEKLARDAEFETQKARLQNLEDAVKQGEFERLIFKQQTDKGYQQLQSMLTGQQEEAANTLEAQLEWLKTQVQSLQAVQQGLQSQQDVQQGLQQSQSLQAGRQEEAANKMEAQLKWLETQVQSQQAVQQGLQQLPSLLTSQQEEAASKLEAKLEWLETQVQSPQAVQHSMSQFDEFPLQPFSEGNEDLRHSLERVQQDFRNDTDELRCELQKVLAESSHQADSVCFAERKCEHANVSCNEALQSIQSVWTELHTMQIGLDNINSEFHASELGASLLRKTTIEQIEQTIQSFEQRLFPNRRQEDNPTATRVGGGFSIHYAPTARSPVRSSDNAQESEDYKESATEQQPVAGPALAAARATRSSSAQRPQSARAHRGTPRHRLAASHTKAAIFNGTL